MRICPVCHSEVSEQAHFCNSCGTSLTPNPVTPATASLLENSDNNIGNEHYTPLSSRSYEFEIEKTIQKRTLVQRVIQLLLKPAEEWQVIANERPNKKELLIRYVLVLAIVPAVCSFLYYAVFSEYTVIYGVVKAISQYLLAITMVYVSSIITDKLSPSFEAEHNPERSFQLVTYAMTPVWVSSILWLVPGISVVSSIIGFAYMLYILMKGIPVMKQPLEEKVKGFTILLSIIMFILFLLIGAIISFILLKILFRGIIYMN